MPLQDLDKLARLYVGSDAVQSGTLREMITTWSNLPEGQNKENAHITMVYEKVVIPGMLDEKMLGTLYAVHMRLLISTL